MAQRFGVTQGSISELLKRHGVKAFREFRTMRRYSIKEDYFARVETPEQAYWLGFLAADGLAVRDVAHVELFRAAIGADDQPLHFIGPSGFGGSGVYHLRVNSTRMVQDVARYGIIPRKTQHCEPWPAPSELEPHYWRGLIDGDGHIAASGRYMSFCGTRAMVEAFRTFAAKVCGTSGTPRHTASERPLWFMHLMGRRQVHAMLSTLYTPDCIALARKKEEALRITSVPYKFRTSPACRVEGCSRKSVARELCGRHYQRWAKYGDPEAPDRRYRRAA